MNQNYHKNQILILTKYKIVNFLYESFNPYDKDCVYNKLLITKCELRGKKKKWLMI